MKVDSYEQLKAPGDFFFHRQDGAITGICIQGPQTTVSVSFKSNPHAIVTWDWDGNEEAPTLHPSIWLDRGGPHDWHFWFKNGEIIPA